MGGSSTSSFTNYTYAIKFPHTSIDPSQSIIFYDAFGTEIYTVPPYYAYMDYSKGVLNVPGTMKNSDVERVSTSTYYVFYSSDDLIIDYENTSFKIAKKLIKFPAQMSVTATFEYYTVFTPVSDIGKIIDGRWDTQVQTEFVAEPPTGYNYGILDLGQSYNIQALDIIAGFYKPDAYRKFDIKMTLSLQYSLNGTNYYNISDETNSFDLTGGSSKSFEESDLGIGFEARYLKLLLEDVDKIEYGSISVVVDDTNRAKLIADGVVDSDVSNGDVALLKSGTWVVALTEVAAYDNIVLKSNITLIPTTYTSVAIDLDALDSGDYPTTIYVDSTEGFELESSETIKTAYIQNSDKSLDVFVYTGTTATSFTGVSGLSSSHAIDSMVVSEEETDTTVYDYSVLLPKIGDRLYKHMNVDSNSLYTQAQLDYIAKEYQKEFIKNHSKLQAEVLYSPHIQIGSTIKLENNNLNYFVEGIVDNSGFFTISLARYPSS